MNVGFSGLFLIAIIGFHQEVQASCPTIISRQSWRAKSARNRQYLAQNPAPYVVIHHSETPSCNTVEKCKQRIKNIQDYHIDSRGWSDIGYNFLIGGDGNVYEGRGWGIRGSHVPKYNARSIGICMIGSFENTPPPISQMESLKSLIACAKETNKITSNYHLIGHRQGKATTCPGDALFNEIKGMTNWDSNPN